MSIEKKSLISTLKTTKKANVASAPVSAGVKAESIVSKKIIAKRYLSAKKSTITAKRVFSNKRALD